MITVDIIAPYFPYGLKAYNFDDERSLESFCRVVELRDGEVTISNSDYEYHVFIKDLKPILRPMGSLTDDEWRQVFRAGLYNTWPCLPSKFLNEPLSVEYHDNHIMVEAINDGGNSFTFELMSQSFSTQGIRFNQLAAFNELYKLHADLYYLIDKGLAIDVNALNVQL